MDLCTLQEVKNWVNIVPPIANTAEDGILQPLIGAVSANIRQYCGRDFDSQSYSEVYNGPGSDKLFLKNNPVTAVSSVVVNGQTIPLSTAFNRFGYQFDSNMLYMVNGASQIAGFGSGGSFSRGLRNISVTYTAGYVRNATPSLDALPQDLRYACIQAVTLQYRRRIMPHKLSETLGGENTTYLNEQFTKEVRGVLDRYRRVIPINTV